MKELTGIWDGYQVEYRSHDIQIALLGALIALFRCPATTAGTLRASADRVASSLLGRRITRVGPLIFFGRHALYRKSHMLFDNSRIEGRSISPCHPLHSTSFFLLVVLLSR